jgi:hypothetical protein
MVRCAILHMRWKLVLAGLALGLVALVGWVTISRAGGKPAARVPVPMAVAVRGALFRNIQPVTLSECRLERFGEAHDGGYLLCGNLLDGVEAGYSYGISGYDGWGCDVSRRLTVPVHQYDCFDTRRPACVDGRMLFHEECVGEMTGVQDGRRYDTIAQQVDRNGDGARRLVVKMDVEGAEWNSLLSAPRALLERIDQLAVEFHGVDDTRYIVAVQRLKEIFHIAHLHYNNYACRGDVAPFPADTYEVLFVNRRLITTAREAAPALPHPLDAPNDAGAADCQTVAKDR